VWHFPDKGFGSADVPAAAGGGVVPGETDLAVIAAGCAGVPLLALGEPGGSGGDEDDGERGLGGGGGLDALEFGDLVDQFGVGSIEVDGAELIDELSQVDGGQYRGTAHRRLRVVRHCVRLYPFEMQENKEMGQRLC
jgi:hypothetical protein